LPLKRRHVKWTDENSLLDQVWTASPPLSWMRRRRWQIKGKASRHFGAKREVISRRDQESLQRFLCQVRARAFQLSEQRRRARIQIVANEPRRIRRPIMEMRSLSHNQFTPRAHLSLMGMGNQVDFFTRNSRPQWIFSAKSWK